MERRVRGNLHARCEVGENSEIISKSYLSLYLLDISYKLHYNEIEKRRYFNLRRKSSYGNLNR